MDGVPAKQHFMEKINIKNIEKEIEAHSIVAVTEDGIVAVKKNGIIALYTIDIKERNNWIIYVGAETRNFSNSGRYVLDNSHSILWKSVKDMRPGKGNVVIFAMDDIEPISFLVNSDINKAIQGDGK